jgi:predicted DNA binding CopG/RHH family protein
MPRPSTLRKAPTKTSPSVPDDGIQSKRLTSKDTTTSRRTKSINVALPVELVAELKARATMDGRPMQDVVADALTTYLQ